MSVFPRPLPTIMGFGMIGFDGAKLRKLFDWVAFLMKNCAKIELFNSLSSCCIESNVVDIRALRLALGWFKIEVPRNLMQRMSTQ